MGCAPRGGSRASPGDMELVLEGLGGGLDGARVAPREYDADGRG